MSANQVPTSAKTYPKIPPSKLGGPSPAQTIGIPLIRSSATGRLNERDMLRAEEVCKSRGWKFCRHLAVSTAPRSAYGKASSFDPFLKVVGDGGLPLSNTVLLVASLDRTTGCQVERSNSTLWRAVKGGLSVLFISSDLLLKKGDEKDISKRIRVTLEFQRAHAEHWMQSQLAKARIQVKGSKQAKTPTQ